MKHGGVEKTKSEKLTFTPPTQGMVDEVDKLLGMIFGANFFFFLWVNNGCPTLLVFLFGFLHPFKEADRMTLSATNTQKQGGGEKTENEWDGC